MTGWRDQTERGHLGTVRLMRRIVEWVPRPLARLLLYPVAAYYVIATGQARRASADFLARALGRRPTWRDRFRHYLWFATVVMDRVYLLKDRVDAFDLVVEGEAQADRTRRAGQGFFLMGAHLGSFEALRALGRDRHVPRVTMVMYEDNARMINAVLNELNPGLQQAVIGLGRPGSMLKVRDALDQGAVIGILADRVLDSERHAPDTVYLPFLGKPAGFPSGPFRMAALLRRPVLLMLGLYVGGNRYRIVFEPIHDFSQPDDAPRDARIRQALQCYVSRLEHYARLYPYNWFNFFDFWQDDPQPEPDTQAHGA